MKQGSRNLSPSLNVANVHAYALDDSSNLSTVSEHKTWRSNLFTRAGARPGKIRQWPPPKPDDDEQQAETTQLWSDPFENPRVETTSQSNLHTTRGKGKICIDSRLNKFGGGTRKLNARTRLEPKSAPSESVPCEHIALDATPLNKTIVSSKPTKLTSTDASDDDSSNGSDDGMPFAGLKALRTRKPAIPTASTDPSSTSNERKPSQMSSWFEDGVNTLERTLGVDMDGDGDVGLKGHQHEPNGLFQAVSSFVARFSEREQPTPADVQKTPATTTSLSSIQDDARTSDEGAEPNAPNGSNEPIDQDADLLEEVEDDADRADRTSILASYRAKPTDYAGRDSRIFSMTNRAARNEVVSSETKLMATVDEEEKTNGGSTFRERMRSGQVGGAGNNTFRLRQTNSGRMALVHNAFHSKSSHNLLDQQSTDAIIAALVAQKEETTSNSTTPKLETLEESEPKLEPFDVDDNN